MKCAQVSMVVVVAVAFLFVGCGKQESAPTKTQVEDKPPVPPATSVVETAQPPAVPAPAPAIEQPAATDSKSTGQISGEKTDAGSTPHRQKGGKRGQKQLQEKAAKPHKDKGDKKEPQI